MSLRRLLALNVGSATLKAALFQIDSRMVATGPGVTELARAESEVGGAVQDRLDVVLQSLPSQSQAPDVVVHRIVHGGELTHGRELEANLLSQLEALAPLAPLHQSSALAFVQAALARWPTARHGAAFDTSFHATLAPWSRRLPIPSEWDAQGVRRYGFHGLAFASALRAVAEEAPGIESSRAVFAHLGGGCSVCAVKNGLSQDTTMALTPLGGVQGPTRSGDLDPGVVLHLLRTTGSPELVQDGLSRRGGLAGIANQGDMRTLLARSDEAAQLAVEQFVVRIAQSIAAMATAIGGIDHLVFSGGIGNRAPAIREQIVSRLGWLGLALDAGQNVVGALRIDRSDNPAIWNVAIDEERELAQSSIGWLGSG